MWPLSQKVWAPLLFSKCTELRLFLIFSCNSQQDDEICISQKCCCLFLKEEEEEEFSLLTVDLFLCLIRSVLPPFLDFSLFIYLFIFIISLGTKWGKEFNMQHLYSR